MNINRFKRYWSHDIGIDLGTANTLVYVRGHGIVLKEPSVVAINKRSKKVLSIGAKAKKMIGKTPKEIIAARPLVDGVVSDFEITEKMLKYFIRKIHKRYPVIWPRPRVVVGLPSGVTEVEKRAVEEATHSAGARAVYLVEEPMAAAIGCRLPVKEAKGSMIIDIGGGTTEVAIISLGGIVISKSLRIAGDELNEAIMQFMRNEYNLQIGETSAEQAKIKIGGVFASKKPKTMTIRGRNLVSGLPQEVVVNSENLRVPLTKQVRPIIDVVKNTLEEAPPELVADISKTGIIIVGGGALLKGLAELINQETKVKTRSISNALSAVVEGTGLVLEDLDNLKDVLVNSR